MKIVCISDSHGQNLRTKWKWPSGDILIHAGDATALGTHEQLIKFAMQMRDLPYEYKIFVPGNHDKLFSQDKLLAINTLGLNGIVTLIDKFIQIDGLKFYGCPWIQAEPKAFRLLNPDALNFTRLDCTEYYKKIPADTNVLITHQPGMFLDESQKWGRLGSSQLGSVIYKLTDLKLHAFGHVHNSHGFMIGRYKMVNAALCDEEYKPIFEPICADVNADPG